LVGRFDPSTAPRTSPLYLRNNRDRLLKEINSKLAVDQLSSEDGGLALLYTDASGDSYPLGFKHASLTLGTVTETILHDISLDGLSHFRRHGDLHNFVPNLYSRFHQ
jgi:hypothetical protein